MAMSDGIQLNSFFHWGKTKLKNLHEGSFVLK